MNDPQLSLKNLDDLLAEANNPDLTLPEKAALYSTARFIVADFEEYFSEKNGSSYANEKLGKYQWHIGAMLGFDVTNGHDRQAHYVWGLGQLGTFKQLVAEAEVS